MTPNRSRNGSSLRVMRRLCGRVATRAATRISAAPVERTSVSRSDESPELSAAFAIEPLIPQSAVAARTIE